jgi:hypothetical protein
VGERRSTNEPLNTFGSAGVVECRSRPVCCVSFARVASSTMLRECSTVAAVYEASSRYLGWDMQYHAYDNGAC